MKSITLVLSTSLADEFGRLPLPTVLVAGPGECGSQERPSLGREIADLDDRIHAALREEGMAPVLDPYELRLAVSQALLAPADGEEILIPLPVRKLPDEDAGGVETEELLDPEPLFDGLFDAGDLGEEEVPDA